MTSSGRKRRGEDAECHSYLVMAIRVPVPFRGSANVERFPRTFQSALGRTSISGSNSGDRIRIEYQLAKCTLQFLARS